MKRIALIPARSQSKRVPNKNIRLFRDHPLMAYSICSALDSGLFDKVVVSTDSKDYAWLAEKYGAEVCMRPAEFAIDTSPDIEWIKYTLGLFYSDYEYFSILRPTSPFRTADTIRRAWYEFDILKPDSIRAVELCSQHPCKMWRVVDGYIKPLLNDAMHSQPYQTLPKVYVQNASLEIARVSNVFEHNSIAGNIISPFFTEGYEGFDINVPYDLKYAEWLVETGQARLPDVRTKG